MTVTPFRIAVRAADIQDLQDRLPRTRWPEKEPVDDWSQGIPLAYLREVCDYWADGYDWPAREARMNRFDQFTTEIDGVSIHFLHVRSPHPDATPLLLTHGWPGSVVEFMDVIGPLTDPPDPRDAFHVIVPSLPGYAWSGKPTQTGWSIQHIADAWAELMTRLGYDRFAAQGGDWGSAVTTNIARRHADRVIGIHLNMVVNGPPAGQTTFTEREQRGLAAAKYYRRWESGYARQQDTRPQTLGYGLTDSPSGQCGWILEKFRAWSDCGDDPVAGFGIDRVLDNISVYWFTASATSSARLYWESLRSAWIGAEVVDVPTGVSLFPKDISAPTREWVQRQFVDLRMWHELDHGGHFAAFEKPDTFVDEVRGFFRSLQ